MKRTLLLYLSALIFPFGLLADTGPYFGNALKIGEVTQDSAIIWTRLTQTRFFNTQGRSWVEYPVDSGKKKSDGTPKMEYHSKMPDGATLADMEFSLMGAPGQVRLTYWPRHDRKQAVSQDWMPVGNDRDHTTQIVLENLQPGTRYDLVMEARSLEGKISDRVDGQFSTAWPKDSEEEVNFTVVTCHDFNRRDDLIHGHLIYPSMARVVKPHFLVHAGDIVYYDKANPWARNAEFARYKWNRIFSLPYQVDFYRQFPVYFIKDDHETLKNDSWPGQTYGDLTWKMGLALYREQVPMGEKTYRTIRWGKDLQIWMVEGRDFRSPNKMPDGPGKTIWGEEQKKWLFDSFSRSDATFRILISPTPIVGPDRENKNDNHSNKSFTWEGDQVRDFLGGEKNAFVICGDRHWQYATVDPRTGVREFSVGAGSDVHAGGFQSSKRTEAHRFLRIAGGFLGVRVYRDQGTPTIIFTHYNVDGGPEHRETFTPE